MENKDNPNFVKVREVKKKLKMLEEFCIYDSNGRIFAYLRTSKTQAELDRRATKIAKDFLDRHEDILAKRKVVV